MDIYAILAIQGATFEEGSGGQWDREWFYNGNESTLDDSTSSNTSCTHSEDASVICSGSGKSYRAYSVWHITTLQKSACIQLWLCNE